MAGMLTGKTCIITGAGRGIGKADALLLAREGGRMVLTDIDREPLVETVAEIKAAGGEAVAAPGDVTAAGFAESLVQAAVTAFGPSIDVIVNNAGYTWDGVIHKMSDDQFMAMLEVHNLAPFRIIKAAAPYIRDAAKEEIKQGKRVMRKIINVSSVSGIDGNAGQINYATAKAGVVGMTKAIAKEWGRFNVNCNAVAYGFIETRLTQDLENNFTIKREGKEIQLGVPRQNRHAFKLLCPLGRPGTPEEAAGPVLFLASSLSDYITGQVLLVDGGGI